MREFAKMLVPAQECTGMCVGEGTGRGACPGYGLPLEAPVSPCHLESVLQEEPPCLFAEPCLQ